MGEGGGGIRIKLVNLRQQRKVNFQTAVRLELFVDARDVPVHKSADRLKPPVISADNNGWPRRVIELTAARRKVRLLPWSRRAVKEPNLLRPLILGMCLKERACSRHVLRSRTDRRPRCNKNIFFFFFLTDEFCCTMSPFLNIMSNLENEFFCQHTQLPDRRDATCDSLLWDGLAQR